MSDADDDPCVYVSTALHLVDPEAPPVVRLQVERISVCIFADM